MNHYDNNEMAASLDRFVDVPADVLWRVVTRDGLCFWAFDRDEMPDLVGDENPDRALALDMCAGCPVTDECLELELRVAGPLTIGVWGGLPDSDRREVYQVWKWRHINRGVWAGEES